MTFQELYELIGKQLAEHPEQATYEVRVHHNHEFRLWTNDFTQVVLVLEETK
jgi:hypothetical protein